MRRDDERAAPTTEATADKLNLERGPMLIVSGGAGNIVPWKLANAANKGQRKDAHHPTEIVEIPGVGHSLVFDSHWGEVADDPWRSSARLVSDRP